MKIFILSFFTLILTKNLFSQSNVTELLYGDWVFVKTEPNPGINSISHKDLKKSDKENEHLIITFNKYGKFKSFKVVWNSKVWENKLVDSGKYELLLKGKFIKTNGKKIEIVELDKNFLKMKVDNARTLVFKRPDLNNFLQHQSIPKIETPISIDINNVSEYENEYVTICTKVYGIKETSNIIFVELGGSYPHQLVTVSIVAKAKDYFQGKVFKNICVTGKVRLTGTLLEIVVTDPKNLQIGN